MSLVHKIDANLSGGGCGCDDPDGQTTLISIDEALSRIAQHTQAITESQDVSLTQAKGRVLAAPVRALGMAPPFDNAAMDGYAAQRGRSGR